MKRVEVNPGEWFAVSNRVILVDERESILGMLGKIGTVENDRVGYLFTFVGRRNNTGTHDTVTVALSPEDAFELASDILDGLRLLTDG